MTIQTQINFDTPLAEAGKQIGMQTVERNEDQEWMDQAMEHITTLARTRQSFTSDEVRQCCLGSGMLLPHHANVWGCVMSKAAKLGIITNSGRYISSKVIGNHCRKLPVWLSLLN